MLEPEPGDLRSQVARHYVPGHGTLYEGDVVLVLSTLVDGEGTRVRILTPAGLLPQAWSHDNDFGGRVMWKHHRDR